MQQTLDDLEVIVVDDGSTDDSVEQARQIQDGRLRVVAADHRGAPETWNTALDLARGRYVGFLDHDDVWLENKLARHVEFLENHPDVDLTFSWARFIDTAGRALGVHGQRWTGRASFRQLLADFSIGSKSSVVMRRSALDLAGRCRASLARYFDMELFLRVALLRPGNVHAIPEELFLYRRHGGQLSASWEAMQGEWKQLLDIVRTQAPDETASVERLASSNMYRYFAWIAYEYGDFGNGRALLRQSRQFSPRTFWADPRNWRVGGAILAASVFPRAVHRRLERLAGVRRPIAPAEHG